MCFVILSATRECCEHRASKDSAKWQGKAVAADQKELVPVFRVVLQEMDLSIDQEYGHCFLGRATVRHVLDKQLHLHTHTHTHSCSYVLRASKRAHCEITVTRI